MKPWASRTVALSIGVVLALFLVVAMLMVRYGPRPVWRLLAGDRHPEQEYLWSEVASEIAEVGKPHSWAGKYLRCDGFTGEYVCIAPRSGFFRWHFWDAGPPFASVPERGSVRETDGVLHLSPPSPTDPDEAYRPSNDFIPVSWGERRYLIPFDRVEAFCRAIRAGTEPRSHAIGSWLLREGDERLPPEPVDAIQPPGLCR